MIEARLSNQLLRGFFNVYHEHGHGFLEPVYSNALAVELQFLGLKVRREVPKLAEADQRQLLNYLKATPYELGFLLNFGPRPVFLRRLLTNDRKHSGQAV